MGLSIKEKKKFSINIERRYLSSLVSILENDVAIGWITLYREDNDFIPHINSLIEKMNDKYKSDEIIASTTTTGDKVHSK